MLKESWFPAGNIEYNIMCVCFFVTLYVDETGSQYICQSVDPLVYSLTSPGASESVIKFVHIHKMNVAVRAC
jgi:hypothetical protein